jgi:transposase InsO family protein
VNNAVLIAFTGWCDQLEFARKAAKPSASTNVVAHLHWWRTFTGGAQSFAVTVKWARANRVWVTDITYIRTYEGWLYLTVVIDLFRVRSSVDR